MYTFPRLLTTLHLGQRRLTDEDTFMSLLLYFPAA